MQDQTLGVGLTGSKSMHPSINSGNPGGTVMPTSKAPTGEEGFGWKALDYKFGDKPIYQVMKSIAKNKADGGGFCGKSGVPQGGMSGAGAAANAAQVAGMASPGAAGAAMNPDPVSPAAEAPAITPETEELFL